MGTRQEPAGDIPRLGRLTVSILAALAVGILAIRGTFGTICGARRGAEGIAADPLDLDALRVLGLQGDATRTPGRTARVLSFVGRRTWRDGPTNVWLLRQALEEGRFAEAFDRADAILRQDADGRSRPALFDLLSKAAAFPEARPDLEGRLAASPTWREDFLAYLGQKGDPSGALAILSGLADSESPPTPAEYSALVNRLVSGGEPRAGLKAWVEVARPRGGEAAGLRDGGFQGQWDHTPFTWSVAEGVGGESETHAAPRGIAGRVLRVDYDGYAAPSLPAQLLVLGPGAYRVTWLEQPAPARAGSLYWRVRCADTGAILARADQAKAAAGEDGGWRAMSLRFDAPAQGCPGQWLELIAAPGERPSPITAEYAEFALLPAS